jgi:hypothetical protein
MTDVARDGADKCHFDIVQITKHHETHFSLPVGPSHSIRFVENEPHVMQIDLALPQISVSFGIVRTENLTPAKSAPVSSSVMVLPIMYIQMYFD